MMNKTKIVGLVGSALLIFGTQAQAGITWTFDSNPNSGFTTIDSTSVKQTADGVTVTAQGWSNTNNSVTSGTGSSGPLGSSSLSTSGSYKLETAYLTVYDGGIGTKNRDLSSSSSYGDNDENNQPEHAVDNNQRYDSVLFSFDSVVDLSSVKIGYGSSSGYDSDITVLAYTGTGTCVGLGTCTSTLSGNTYSQLISLGWSLIGQYSNLANNMAMSVNAGNVLSSFWLIGAANPLVGGAVADTTKDYVKLLALSGDKYSPPPPPPRGAPEPGTLLLMGAGLLGLTRINTRRVVRSAA